jgi:hypothetical protein
MSNPSWYKTAWRRSVLDMHITDHDPSFLAKYDPGEYVALLRKTGVGSAVIYAHSHVGFALYPSMVAPPHPCLNGRDLLGDTVAECHRAGIGVSVYMSLIFDVAAYRREPGWRIRLVDGRDAAHHDRYGVCCPNSPYRDYAPEIAREICERYEFEGIRFDMTFWPHVCYCPHCRKRYDAEVGGALPQIVDWNDPRWVAFQRCRERWLAEFGAKATAAVRAAKPSASVEHQASTYPCSWRFGVTDLLAPHQDFMQGDFYGDSLQGSIARKLLSNLSPNRPIGFETSIASDLRNYTAVKPAELLEAKAHAAIGDGAAFIFIDSVDPVGTVNPVVYERMSRIFSRTRVYDPFLGGDRTEDVVLYASFFSKHDPADNGKRVDDPHLSGRVPHYDAISRSARTLIERHVPWGIASRRNLGELSRWKAVVLPGVLALGDDEADALRAYVAGGGRLYASRQASLVGTDGKRRPDYQLADVFGVSWKAETKEAFTYMAPTDRGRAVFGDYTPAHPLGLFAPQAIAEARPGVDVLATITLPYTDPADPVHFTSIHNNPPGIATSHPALVVNRFGKGMSVWSAGDLETAELAEGVFANVVGLLAGPLTVETDAPKPVEVTTFRQASGRWLVTLLNFQRDLPPVPVEGIAVRLRFGPKKPAKVALAPEGAALPFTHKAGVLSFILPRLEVFAMVVVDP